MALLRNPKGRVRLGWRLLLFLVLTAFLSGILSLLPYSIVAGDGLPLLLGTVLAGWAVLRLDGRGFGALGFYAAPAAGREILLGLALGMVLILTAVFLVWMVGGYGWSSEGGTASGFARMAGSSLWFFFVFGAVEEALLRGYPLQALAEAWGPAPALWATSVAFALLHLANPNVNVLGIVNIGVAGLFLGVVYLKTASLWWATGAHVGWNWAQAFWADLPTSGIDPYDTPFLEPVTREPAWLSGGEFGPEGSVVATAVVSLATLVLWRTGWLSPSHAAIDARPLVLRDLVADGAPSLTAEG